MRSPVEIVDFIFSKGGPLEKIGKSHRREQADMARDRIETLVGRDTSKDRNISLIEAETGIGKSLAILVPAAVLARYGESPRKTVIATGTISLREELTNEKQVREVNQLVKAGFAWAGLPEPDDIRIAERPSYTAFTDLDKAKTLLAHLKAHPPLPEHADAHSHSMAYAEFVIENPEATFDEWLGQSESNGVMPSVVAVGAPLGTAPTLMTSLDLCLAFDLRRAAKTKIERFGQMIEAAKNCDIMVTTHTMLAMNILTFGNALSSKADFITKDGEEHEQSEFRDLVIDEADNLLSLANNVTDQMVELDDVREFLDEVDSDDASDVIKVLNKIEAMLEKIYPKANRSHPQSLTAVPGFNYHAFMDDVDLLESGLRKIAKAGDVVTQLRGESLFRVLSFLTQHRSRAGTTSENAARSDYTKTMPFVDVNYADRKKLRIGTKPTRGRGLVNRLWLSVRHSSFETILLMSATLTASNKDFRNFINRVGIYEGESRDIKAKAFSVEKFGKISNIYYADSSVPHPTVQPPKKAGAATGENISGVSYDNPDHLEFVAKTTLFAHKEESRSLVLFSSSHALMAVNALLETVEGHPRLFVQQKGMKTKDLMREFANSSGVWLGLKWAGENFVHPVTGASLLDRVIISKIPFPIVNPVREAEDHFFNVIEDGVRLFRQGIGRGIRNPDDDIDVWICDPRFPKPRPEWENPALKLGSERFRQVAHMAIPERFRSGPEMANTRLIEFENGQVSIRGLDTRPTFSSKNRPKVISVPEPA